MSTPAYLQIVVFLREEILTGKYPDGKLPPTSVLTRRFGTSPGTVSHAFAQLEHDGLIARSDFRPPLIVAKAEPHDNQYVAAITPGERNFFCTKCWAHVHFTEPGTGHACQ